MSARPGASSDKPQTRAEFRRRSIEANTAAYGDASAAAISALREIGLTVFGSGMVGALVLDGTVDQLRRGLSLNCIRTAILDRPLELDTRRQKRQISLLNDLKN